MRNYSATGAFILTCFILVISLVSCGPKYVVRGRVVDAETQQPIQGAAVAIRWYTNAAENQSAKPGTIKSAQSITDDQGVFKIPKYPETLHILGVYKNGYVCWSSQDIFTIDPGMSGIDKYRKRKNHHVNEGMEIELEQLQKSHPKDLHAGFTVMVAGESTDSESGPFHRAIQNEFQLWRENLRKDFQKQVGAK